MAVILNKEVTLNKADILNRVILSKVIRSKGIRSKVILNRVSRSSRDMECKLDMGLEFP